MICFLYLIREKVVFLKANLRVVTASHLFWRPKELGIIYSGKNTVIASLHFLFPGCAKEPHNDKHKAY